MCDAPPRDTITREDARADLATAERILRRGYAGFDVLASQGVDWDALFAAARADVAGWNDTEPTTRLRDGLLRWLAVARDNHLAVFDHMGFYAYTGVHERAYVGDLTVMPHGAAWVVDGGAESGARLEGCDGWALDVLLGRFVDEELHVQRRPMVLSAAIPLPLSCRLIRRGGSAAVMAVPLRRLHAPVAESNRAAYERVDGRVPRLRVRDLSGEREEELAPLVASAAELRSAPAVVLDVRGNGGGSDSPVTAWFTALTDGELRYNTIDELVSEVTCQGTLNVTACSESRSGRRPAWAEALGARARDTLAAARHDGERTFRRYRSYTNVDRGTAGQPYHGALVVLTDNDCASSCETFVLYARQIPGAVVVGQNTAGTGVFGEARSYRLPRSGLGLQAGIKWFHNADPRLTVVEGRGYLPDLWIDSDQAPAIAERIASCLAEPACAPGLRGH